MSSYPRLFVDNLPYSTELSDIHKLFDRYGLIESAKLLTSRDGKFKGSALVEYLRFQDAEYARDKVDRTKFKRKTIYVKIDADRPRGPPPAPDRRRSRRSDLDLRPPRDYKPQPVPVAMPPVMPLPMRPPQMAQAMVYAAPVAGMPVYPQQANYQAYAAYAAQPPQGYSPQEPQTYAVQEPPPPQESTPRLSPEIEFYREVLQLYAEEVSCVVKDNTANHKITIDKLGIAHLPNE